MYLVATWVWSWQGSAYPSADISGEDCSSMLWYWELWWHKAHSVITIQPKCKVLPAYINFQLDLEWMDREDLVVFERQAMTEALQSQAYFSWGSITQISYLAVAASSEQVWKLDCETVRPLLAGRLHGCIKVSKYPCACSAWRYRPHLVDWQTMLASFRNQEVQETGTSSIEMGVLHEHFLNFYTYSKPENNCLDQPPNQLAGMCMAMAYALGYAMVHGWSLAKRLTRQWAKAKLKSKVQEFGTIVID